METAPVNDTRNDTVSLLQSGLTFISPGAVVDIHHHHCYQLCIALQQPFDCLVGNTMLRHTWGFIVNQEVPHNCNAPQTVVLIQFIDADSIWGHTLKQLLNGAPFLEMASLMSPENYQGILPIDHADRPAEELHTYIDTFLQRLFPSSILQPDQVQDERIVAALQYVDQHLHEKLKLDDLAAQIFLSPERTRHLFVAEMGMPFSQYVLWKRIRGIAATVTRKQATLAEACIQYGFTDYPHFSRIFHRMFGVAPKSVLGYCRVIL